MKVDPEKQARIRRTIRGALEHGPLTFSELREQLVAKKDFQPSVYAYFVERMIGSGMVILDERWRLRLPYHTYSRDEADT